jgi:hypothetical protein
MSVFKLSIRLGCVAALAIAVGAYAASSRDTRLFSNGSGSASFKIWGGAGQPLYPGAPAVPVNLGFTNPNSFPITVSRVTVRVSGTTNSACDRSNFVTSRQLGVAVRIPAAARISLSQLGVSSSAWPHLAMVASPAGQDACQNASLRLAFAGRARGAVRADVPIGVADGLVYVNGRRFAHGAVAYGTRVLIMAGGRLRLHTKSGWITVYPPPGRSVRFVVRRTSFERLPYTELRLSGPYAACGAGVNSLWARGAGRLRVRGRFAVATAHDAWWLTEDRCRSTRIAVRRRTVRVNRAGRLEATFLSAGQGITARGGR